MPTYLYETIPDEKGEQTRRFEMRQAMMDAPLKKDPETGQRVRRVITGGLEIPRGTSKPQPRDTGAGPGCGGACSCHP
jgi:predicted nucleic acid-binding Zn ribbon protein